MAVLGFLGRRATDDWATDVRPKNWRQGILRFYPNGMMPLTGLLSLGKSEAVDDPEFNWWDRELATQTATLVDIFTIAGTPPTVPETGESTAGTTLFAQIDNTVADKPLDHFRIGQLVGCTVSTSPEIIGYAKVTAKTESGANSSLDIKVLKTTTDAAFTNATVIEVMGNLNAEGAVIPDAINYDPNKRTNFTQIWRNPLDITRTAKFTRYRTGDAYMDLKMQALEYHGIGMEESLLYGVKSENNGSNGHPERSTQGILEFIKEHGVVADQIVDWRDSGEPSATAFDSAAGEAWLDDRLETLFRFANSDTMMGVGGSKAILGINQLAKASGNFDFHAETAAFGITIVRLTTAFGQIILKTHPLLTHRAHRRDTLFLFNPDNIRFRHITDTMFKGSRALQEADYLAQDGLKEEYLTEGGYEFHIPKTFMHLSGLGEDVP